MRPVAILAALIAVAIALWQNRGTEPAQAPGAAPPVTRSSAPAEPAPLPANTSSAAEATAPTVPEKIIAATRSDDEAQTVAEVVALVEAGGPFPYRKDGSIFSNRERALPQKPRGYYREYTVPTPGEDDRGARRIVRGAEGETYYTRDHYRTFVRVD